MISLLEKMQKTIMDYYDELKKQPNEKFQQGCGYYLYEYVLEICISQNTQSSPI